MFGADVRVALVHDYLTQYGGAERVLEALHDLFPTAPVFTSFVDLDSLPEHFQGWNIEASPFQMLPRSERYHRLLLPLFPLAFRSFTTKLREFDLVIADSSAWAHGVVVRDDATLICYCHSPARFLYQDRAYLDAAQLPTGVEQISAPLFAALRRHDLAAAQRVDHYIANSQNVANRIRETYCRDATVVYPPVETERFAQNAPPMPEEDWYLVVSRLVPHKHVELAVDACNLLGRPLKIIGSGRAEENLRKRAGPFAEFLGNLGDDEVVGYLQRCRALILPAVEDLGMTAIEAQAAGRPVIAFGAGGARETVIEEETGMFFNHPTADSLIVAIKRFEDRQWDPAKSIANAARFDVKHFREQISEQIERAVANKLHGARSIADQ